MSIKLEDFDVKLRRLFETIDQEDPQSFMIALTNMSVMACICDVTAGTVDFTSVDLDWLKSMWEMILEHDTNQKQIELAGGGRGRSARQDNVAEDQGRIPSTNGISFT